MDNIILHIPHSSVYIPEEYRKNFVLSEVELEKELLCMTDRYTDELFDGAEKVIFSYSRLICDVERFLDKSQEEMTKKGMWIVYSKTSEGKELKTGVNEEQIVNEMYIPHHRKMDEKVAGKLTKYNECVIVDCHSFSSEPLLYEDCKGNRADICIGTDEYHTPNILLEKVTKFFREKGYSVAVNSPYAGAFVPTKYYRKNKRVQAIMVEVNRKLYMDESSGEKIEGFYKIQQEMKELVNKLGQ